MRHDVLDVVLEQLLGRDLVVHEHAGAAQELHGLEAGRCRERQVSVSAHLQGAADLQPADLLCVLRVADVVVAQERIPGRGGVGSRLMSGLLGRLFGGNSFIQCQVLWWERLQSVSRGEHRRA